jgi:hypothetical protein
MKTKNARQTVKRQNLRNRKHKDENFRRKDNTLEVERNLRTSDALRKKKFFSKDAAKLSRKTAER